MDFDVIQEIGRVVSRRLNSPYQKYSIIYNLGDRVFEIILQKDEISILIEVSDCQIVVLGSPTYDKELECYLYSSYTEFTVFLTLLLLKYLAVLDINCTVFELLSQLFLKNIRSWKSIVRAILDFNSVPYYEGLDYFRINHYVLKVEYNVLYLKGVTTHSTRYSSDTELFQAIVFSLEFILHDIIEDFNPLGMILQPVSIPAEEDSTSNQETGVLDEVLGKSSSGSDTPAPSSSKPNLPPSPSIEPPVEGAPDEE